MSTRIPIRISPAAILKAVSVMPNILKIRLPASANEHSTIAQVNAERRATPRRSDGVESAVTARNKGITANGSTRKNTEVIASKANSRTTLIESAIKCSAQPSRPSHDSILAQRPAAEKSAKRSDRIAHRVIALFKYDGATRRSSLLHGQIYWLGFRSCSSYQTFFPRDWPLSNSSRI